MPQKIVRIAKERSKENNTRTKILFSGESVAQQLFEDINPIDTITSISCNEAIDIIGQYFLIKSAVENMNIEKIYLVYNPFSLKNALNTRFTYNNFLRYFYTKEYRDQISNEAYSQIKNIPFYRLSQFPPLAITGWVPSHQSNLKNGKPYNYLKPDIDLGFCSNLTYDYLCKIDKLSKQYNIEFYMLCPPLKESNSYEADKLKSQYLYSCLRTDFLDKYYNSIYYMNDSLYHDKLHFKAKYISYARRGYLKRNGIYQNTQ